MVDYSRKSLVGAAREGVVDASLDFNADYILWWDDDMRFDPSVFIRLWRNQVPVVGALSFTARHPIFPVVYDIRMTKDQDNDGDDKLESDMVFNYPKDRLFGSDDIRGSLAFGAGVMLTETAVFKAMPKPWFNSTGCGEDWFFCHRCAIHGIPRFVDSRVKTQHKEHAPRWADEASYLEYRKSMPDAYEAQFGKVVDWTDTEWEKDGDKDSSIGATS